MCPAELVRTNKSKHFSKSLFFVHSVQSVCTFLLSNTVSSSNNKKKTHFLKKTSENRHEIANGPVVCMSLIGVVLFVKRPKPNTNT